jgi:hypothetical protein
MAAEAFVLFLDEKNQKSSQQRGFFAARGLYPAKRVKPRAAKLLPNRSFLASQKFANALPSPRAILVLPAFARSLSADGFAQNQYFAK